MQSKLIIFSLYIKGFFFHSFMSGDDYSKRITIHNQPSILAKNSFVSDWPRYNGPFDNASSPETKIIEEWGNNGPKLIWEIKKGEGYSSPAISRGVLVLFHRDDGMEIIEGLNPENGKQKWSYSYPVEYRDRYGYSNGPRASPVIFDNFVYCHGVTSWMTCLNLTTGELIWKRDLAKEFEIPNYFFGKGSNPVFFKNTLILNIGGSKNRCIAGLNAKTGKTEWIAKDTWGASYSSPVITKMHERDICLVFTGGESRPPTGGLIVLDPENGEKLARYPWRSSKYESANAVPPIPLPGNMVFLSECYEKGSVVIRFKDDFTPQLVWSNKNINIHWMTPVVKNGLMYGISGRHQQGAETFCLNPKNGKIYWKESIYWNHFLNEKEIRLGLFRGAILKLENHFICLSELGTLLKIDFSEKGWEIQNKKQLFFAPGTWTLPAISRGLLYVMQNETDRMTGKTARLLCFDLRSK